MTMEEASTIVDKKSQETGYTILKWQARAIINILINDGAFQFQ